VTGNYYNFSNIRFAQAPVGNLRFALPLPPTGTNSTIDNGAVSRICPQANPDWIGIATGTSHPLSHHSSSHNTKLTNDD